VEVKLNEANIFQVVVSWYANSFTCSDRKGAEVQGTKSMQFYAPISLTEKIVRQFSVGSIQ
jgi:hypothetical protein